MSDQPERSVLALMPDDTPDYMTQAWLDSLRWALGHEPIVTRFRQGTGEQWEPSSNGIERAIDQATGAERHFVEAFVAWFNVNVWGSMEGAKA